MSVPVQNQAERRQPSAPSLVDTESATPAITLSAVGVTYPGRQPVEALRGFDLTVSTGERVAIVGPSGCGKSTVLALAAGLIEPTAGRVQLDQAVALMPQRDLLVPWRDALGNAALALEAQGVGKREARRRAAPIFERFGLASFERAKTWELSGGMRQRVAFLRTALTGRPLLALDEPFGALDAITRGQMQEWLIGALRTEPRTLLLVTHDVDEALTLCDRIVAMSGRPGEIVCEIAVNKHSNAARIEWQTSPEFAALKAEAMEALR